MVPVAVLPNTVPAALPDAVSLRLAVLDAALPWGGLPAGGLHEVLAAAAGGTGDDAPALAFTAFLAGCFRQAATDGQSGIGHNGIGPSVIWCRPAQRRQEGGLPYGPGLRDYGLEPQALILVEARREQDLFWAMEEALRDGSAAVVVGETGSGGKGVPDIALRRLQLAAERAGRPALLLHPAGGNGRTCPALTRWLVRAHRPASSQSDLGQSGPQEMAIGTQADDTQAKAEPRHHAAEPGWQLSLLRCRGGQPQDWILARSSFRNASFRQAGAGLVGS